MKKNSLTIILSLVAFLAVCDSVNSEKVSEETQLAKAKLLEADASFSAELFREVVANDPSENVFVSPLSISLALGMTMNGARSSTFNEMRETLAFGDLEIETINSGYKHLISDLTEADEKVQMEIANSVWSRQGFDVREEFSQALHDYFNAQAQELDFGDPESVDVINSWVSDKTHEKIESIIDSISPNVVMYLINAVYFKADWKYAFNEEATQPMSFSLDDGSGMEAEMMNQKNKVSYLLDSEVEILDLPYSDGRFSMIFIKPNGDAPINDFVAESFTKDNLNVWFSSLSTDSITFYIPKLELEYFKSVKPDLINLGMPTAFSPNADFSGINDKGGLMISDVLHKTYLKMDEIGTEAAGVTAVKITRTSVGQPAFPTIILNRSYLMLLRDNETGALLFIGKVGRPVSEITD